MMFLFKRPSQSDRKTQLSLVFIVILLALICVTACDKPHNSPHKKTDIHSNTYFASFAEAPKTLDPARSYSSNESLFTAQIYEPVLQYHYLKRPFTLVPLTASQMPKVFFYDAQGNPLTTATSNKKIAFSVYRVQIKPNIYFQPHPAFAKNAQGGYHYHHLKPDEIAANGSLNSFKHNGTRELTAHDYVYQIKRLADPQLNSPILGLMSNHIVGLKDYAQRLNQVYQQHQQNGEANQARVFLDLRQFDFPGVKVIDRYTYEIKINGHYPQFIYWLAMPFFAPIPWEADVFYSQPEMEEHNFSFDWYPVGTGPYMLVENNPNKQMLLKRNPNFHGERYPVAGEADDVDKGLLTDSGLALPFIDQYLFVLEKETIPRWNKFLQGFYDSSSISSDSFDQAVQLDKEGQPEVTAELQTKNVRLQTSVSPSIFYLGFNMRDDVVGGLSQQARKLRQAISIALDYEENIQIFANGRGIAAQGPLPPGIFGFNDGEAGINPYVYQWQDNKPKRRAIADAKKLLAQAGYPNGMDQKTGKQLVLNYDVPTTSGPDEKARLDWMVKQFAKLGIELNIRATQYNRFQEKMRTGNAQIFSWGWLADYPDPENFLFLLYGPNGKMKYGGENAANYLNPEFDRLFEKMKSLPNGPQRQAIINEMVNIVRQDAPWVWGMHPKSFTLSHQWLRINKPNAMANNTLKYQRLDHQLRATKQKQWNKAIWWPLLFLLLLVVIVLIPVAIRYWRDEHRVA